MDILLLHIECFFTPKFLATRYGTYGQQADHILWMKFNCGRFASKYSGANLTTMWFLCRCHYPPDSSLCSLAAIKLASASSWTFRTQSLHLTTMTHALMGSKSISLVNEVQQTLFHYIIIFIFGWCLNIIIFVATK
jgi:hypothetical protein